jgi:hypothetical protein
LLQHRVIMHEPAWLRKLRAAAECAPAAASRE